MKKEWIIIGGAATVATIFASICILQIWKTFRKELLITTKTPEPIVNVNSRDDLYKEYSKVAKLLYDEEIQHWGIRQTVFDALKYQGIALHGRVIEIGVHLSGYEEAKRTLKDGGCELEETWWGVKVNGLLNIYPMLDDGKYAKKTAGDKWPTGDGFSTCKTYKYIPFGPIKLTVCQNVK